VISKRATMPDTIGTTDNTKAIANKISRQPNRIRA